MNQKAASRKTSKTNTGGAEFLAAVEHIRRPDLSVLGSAIRSVPVHLWEENMLMFGAPDRELKTFTGSFPATMRKNSATHPVFVLATGQTGHRLSPCSSKGSPHDKRYIKKGCVAEMGSEPLDRNSYLVESCSFTLPPGMNFSKRLTFFGKIPASCLVDNRRGT